VKLIWGREPAVFWGLVAVLLQSIALLLPFNADTQGAINAATLALAGFLTAAMVSVDAALPALVGLLKAVFAVLLAFGTNVPESTQVGILAVVTALGAFFVRQQVTSKVPAAAPAHLRHV
jgi:hypothetical protein